MSLFLYASAGLIGGAYAMLHKAHVRTDVIYSRLSQRKQAFANLATSLLFFFFCGVLIWKGTEEALYALRIHEHTNSVWAPPIYPVKMMLPVAAFLLLLQGVSEFLRNFMFVTKRWERQ